MGRTKKTGSKQSKTKKMKKEEDLEYSESDSESDSETGSETSSETDEDDKYYEITFDDIKDGDITLPMFGIGISLIALVGFAIYKGTSV